MKHPFFTKTIQNPTDYLIAPSEFLDEPYMLSRDTPATNTSLKMLEPKKQAKSSNNIPTNNNNTVISSGLSPLLEPKKLYSEPVRSEYSDINPNIKELYDKLKKDYEILTNSYNDLVHSKSEISKKIEDMSFKEGYHKNEKDNLLKEIEEKDNEKLVLTKTIAELSQKVSEKEDKIKNMTKLISFLNDRRTKDVEEIDKLNEDMNKLLMQKDQEMKEYKDKIEELQNQLLKDQNFDDRVSNFRQSINSMNDRISAPLSGCNSNGSNGSKETAFSSNDEYRMRLENELKQAKEYFTSEMENLRKESSKEREKYALIIKNKEDEIKKLIEDQNTIKENEAKKYDKILKKYEVTLKLRESEIENFKVKIKKLETIIATYNIKK
jgi:chromosome segregation ATPase